MTSWAYHSDIGQDEYHVWPLNDLMHHDLDGAGCVCDPQVDVIERDSGSSSQMFVHTSFDGRELFEA